METNDPSLFFLGGSPSRHQEPREMTVKQYAEREGVTPITVRRWIEKDALVIRRTLGGGIRILGVRR